MYKLKVSNFLKDGVHFGHSISKLNTKMKPYILMKNKGIHIIDLYKTINKLCLSCNYLNKIATFGKVVLFVGTKRQAKNLIAYYAQKINMPYINERWMGGLLTNFSTIQKSIDKMKVIETNKSLGLYNLISKKERLLISRVHSKLKKNLGTVSQLQVLPDCLIIVDINKEKPAVNEAFKLGIPIVGIADTNSNPEKINFPIPGNDDNSKSINLILYYISNAIEIGIDLDWKNNQIKIKSNQETNKQE
ncbi:30S ribosomal protein S2 [Candidatus Karelsulcia muelleri]